MGGIGAEDLNIHQFRALTPDAQTEILFAENERLRKEISLLNEEISHFRELEDNRKRIRKRRAKAAKHLGVGSLTTADEIGGSK